MVPTALPCFHPSPTDTVAGKHVQPTHRGSLNGGCARHLPQLLPDLGWIFFPFWQCWGWNLRALHALGKQSTPEPHPLLPALDVFCQPSAPKSNHFPCSPLCRAHLPSSTSHTSVYSGIHKAACFQLLGLCLRRPSAENAVPST